MLLDFFGLLFHLFFFCPSLAGLTLNKVNPFRYFIAIKTKHRKRNILYSMHKIIYWKKKKMEK